MEQCEHRDFTHGVDPRRLPCRTGETRQEKDLEDARSAIHTSDESFDFWRDLTPSERRIWSAGYRCAENDYSVRDLPLLLDLIVERELPTEDFTPDELAALNRATAIVDAYNDEGTL
jgi:hypothetical protein